MISPMPAAKAWPLLQGALVGVWILLTFALPVAFVAYLPASVILDRTDGLHVAPWLAIAAPLVGVGLFLIALRIWNRQSRHYQSSGT